MMRATMRMGPTIRRLAAVLLLLAPLFTVVAQARQGSVGGCAACAGMSCCRKPGAGQRAGGPCRLERGCCGGSTAPAAASPVRDEALAPASDRLAEPGAVPGSAVVAIFRVRLLPPDPPERPPEATA
jgi:hypothetical protein